MCREFHVPPVSGASLSTVDVLHDVLHDVFRVVFAVSAKGVLVDRMRLCMVPLLGTGVLSRFRLRLLVFQEASTAPRSFAVNE